MAGGFTSIHKIPTIYFVSQNIFIDKGKNTVIAIILMHLLFM